MTKLSFIVPIYNVAPYLRKCVESLIKQDYSDYEIILVDDGSTDGSGAICDTYVCANDEMSRNQNDEPKVLNEPHLQCSMSRDKSLNDGKINLNEPLSLNDGKPQIQVIHQENGGLSAARNAGLKVAKGEYVCFVDSDDYWEENVLGGLMEQVERENLDVLRFDYRNVRLKVESGKRKVERGEYEVFEPNKTPRYIDRRIDVVDGETYLNERMGYACYAVMFVIKRSLIISDQESVFRIQNHNDEMSRANALNEPHTLNDACLFKEGIYFEDTDWTPRMLCRAKRVASTDTIVYNYLIRQGSITKAVDSNKKKKVLEDKIRLVGEMKRQAEALRKSGRYNRWYQDMIAATIVSIIGMLSREFYSEYERYIEQIKELKVLPIKNISMKARLINISPKLMVTLLHLKNGK